jgi:anaphase-promoting complex subunit 4
MDGVTEKVGMLIVQVERFSRVAATVLYLVFFFFLVACFVVFIKFR